MQKHNLQHLANGYLIPLLGLLVLPNLTFWLLGKEIFLSRSLINVDYLVLAAVLLWTPKPIRYLGFTLLCALDFLTSAGPAFHFSYQSMLQSVLDTFDLQPKLFLPVAVGIVIGSAVLAWSILKLVSVKTRRWQLAVILLLLAPAIHTLDKQLSANILAVNFSTSTIGNVARVIIAEQRREQGSLQAIPDTQAVAADVIWQLSESGDSTLPDSVFLILVESWGLYKDEAINQALFKRFMPLAKNFDMHSGAIAFKGSTVPGELRELCRIAFSGVHPPLKPLSESECLPERLAKLGYSSLGIHGYSGTMFKRRDWYPTLFQSTWFVNELDRRLPQRSRCGVSFRGICDAEVINYLSETQSTQTEHKQFTYLLTLNSHLPVYQPGADAASCRPFTTTANHQQHCYLYQHVTQILDSVMKLSASQTKSSLIVLVGDHMPPFFKKSDRSAYDDEQVPFIVLRSKQ